MSERKEVLNVEETAELLDVSAWTVRDLAHRGDLPARKIGRAWRFSRQALMEYLANGTSAQGERANASPRRIVTTS